MRFSLFKLQLLCMALVLLTESRARAADVTGRVAIIVTDREGIQKWFPDDAAEVIEFIVIEPMTLQREMVIIKRATRYLAVPPNQADLATAAKDLGAAESIKPTAVALGHRLFVRGQRVPKNKKTGAPAGLVAESVIDAGLSFSTVHWHPHASPFTLFKQENLGIFSPDASAMKFTEPRSPEHNFAMSCDEFLKSMQLAKHQGSYFVDVTRGVDSYSFAWVGEYGIFAGANEQAPDEKVLSFYRDILKEPCSQVGDTTFRERLKTTWRSTDEPEPFLSIRGEFDLASPTGAWRTRLDLPEADKCFLTKISRAGSTAPPMWTYSCTFPASTNTYERVIKLVQTALTLEYRPDETAVNANQVLFNDPSKPAWKLVVTKSSTPSVVMLRIAPQQLSTSTIEGALSPVAGSSATTLQAPGGSISEEIEKIRNGEHVPFPPIQAVGGDPSRSSGTGAFAVKNDTAYTLTVLFSGPTERRLEVAPGGSISIDLLPGSYKVAARVSAPDVSPSYGEHVFDRSSSGVTFYIR